MVTYCAHSLLPGPKTTPTLFGLPFPSTQTNFIMEVNTNIKQLVMLLYTVATLKYDDHFSI